MAGKWLTKSDYMKYLTHPAYLWLHKHDKTKLPEEGENDQARFDAGNLVDDYARRLFPGATLVQAPFSEGCKQTQQLVAASTKFILQPSVLTSRNLYARGDILEQSSQGWHLIEVKGAASVKFDHIRDLAFQKLAFEEAGIPIVKLSVYYINNQYVRQGDIEPEKLFKKRDVTKNVEAIMDITKDNVVSALDTMRQPACPNDNPTLAGNLYAWMQVYRHLHPDIPDNSVLNLTRLSLAQLQKLEAAGVREIAAIPSTLRLGPPQRVQMDLVKLGRPAIHHHKIAHELNSLKYPIYFLDYETIAPAVPLYDGTRPYQTLPFQYSLDIIDSLGAPMRHCEFLAKGSDYPVLPLLRQLSKDIGQEGSVVVWYKGFEMSVNDTMAYLHPEFADWLHALNTRVYDLMEIFSNFSYADPGFGGSASIKKVLPVLVPNMTYKELGIQEGMTASNRWYNAASGKLDDTAKQQVYADLLVYCGQDTLAMVRIWEFLRRTVGLLEVSP